MQKFSLHPIDEIWYGRNWKKYHHLPQGNSYSIVSHGIGMELEYEESPLGVLLWLQRVHAWLIQFTVMVFRWHLKENWFIALIRVFFFFFFCAYKHTECVTITECLPIKNSDTDTDISHYVYTNYWWKSACQSHKQSNRDHYNIKYQIMCRWWWRGRRWFCL